MKARWNVYRSCGEREGGTGGQTGGSALLMLGLGLPH